MPFEYLMFWLRETISNVGRNRLMSLLAVSTVTLGLFILGAFYLGVVNLKAAVGKETSKLDLVVFLQHDITAARRKEIIDAAHIPQVKSLKFVGKDEALKEMQRELPKFPLDDMVGDQNFCGDEIRLTLKNPEDIFKVSAYFNSIKGVDQTEQQSDAVREILTLNRFLPLVGFGALIILGLVILLIIHNAIRLTIFARRREIRIMELVGATPWFISMPFLLEGMFYGIVGSLLAGVVLTSLSALIERSGVPLLMLFLPLSGTSVGLQCSVWMFIAGLAFGLAGSWISITRSLDQAAQA